MKIEKIVSSILISFTCLSCFNKKMPDNYISIQPSICDTIQASDIEFTDEVFGSALSMFLIDSLLYIEDYFNRDYSLWAINTHKWTFHKAYYKKGRGPGEVLNPTSNCNYNPENKTISLFEPNYKKLIQYNITNNTYLEDPLPYRDSSFAESFVQDLMHIDSFYIATGTFGLFGTKRFFILNKERKIIKTVQGYPNFQGILSKDIPHICQYANEIRVKPDHSKFVAGTYIGGMLEIFDISQLPDTVKLIKRHLIYYPLYNIQKQGGVILAADTKYGFENIFVTNSYIYTLLFDSNSEQIFPNKIIVFDWEGNPVKSYVTDCMLHCLCIDENKKIIYAMAFSEEKSFYLVKFNLNDRL